MYEKFVLPIINKLDAETEHLLIREFLHLLEESPDFESLIKTLSYKNKRFSDKKLQTTIGNITFDNPLIVGAGWDKEAHAVKALYCLGFGSVEVGSVMEFSQKGNEKPRHFWLSPKVSLNRYGFNSRGMAIIAKNLENYKKSNIPIGINIGKNQSVFDGSAPKTYSSVARYTYDLGQYFVINVSSPNTPRLRQLQDKDPLIKIINEVVSTMKEKGGRKPLFVKIAPDMTFEAVDDVIEAVLETKITGIVATNTTNNSKIKAKYGKKWENEQGGLSGDDPDYRKMSTEIIRYIYKKAGDKLTIIGTGGIKDAQTALEKIRAGATAVQIVSALDNQGPELPGKINEDIVSYMDKQKIKNIKELIGIDAK